MAVLPELGNLLLIYQRQLAKKPPSHKNTSQRLFVLEFIGHVKKPTASEIEASKQLSEVPKKESYDNVKQYIQLRCIQISYLTYRGAV